MTSPITDTYTDPKTGHTINVYENGTRYDMTDKRLIHPPTHAIITAETAPLMHQRRRELAEAAAWDEANKRVKELIEGGNIEGISVGNIDTLAVRALMREAIDGVLVKGKSGREKEAYYTLIFKLWGWNAQRVEVGVQGTVRHEPNDRLVDIVRELREAIGERKPTETIEGIINADE